ncbi:MAG: hypothetical protein ACFE9Z_07255 [Promethearchaeota archaeon]
MEKKIDFAQIESTILGVAKIGIDINADENIDDVSEAEIDLDAVEIDAEVDEDAEVDVDIEIDNDIEEQINSDRVSTITPAPILLSFFITRE